MAKENGINYSDAVRDLLDLALRIMENRNDDGMLSE